jgi:hypothetical protein
VKSTRAYTLFHSLYSSTLKRHFNYTFFKYQFINLCTKPVFHARRVTFSKNHLDILTLQAERLEDNLLVHIFISNRVFTLIFFNCLFTCYDDYNRRLAFCSRALGSWVRIPRGAWTMHLFRVCTGAY